MTQVVTYGPTTPHMGRAAIAIGMFDGVHIGHQTLISHAIGKAHEYGVRSCVVTFDRDPDGVVTPARPSRHLTVFADRIELLSAIGPDIVLVIPFDLELAALPAEEFIAKVLLHVVEPVSVTVGHDFRFGSHALGTVSTMAGSELLRGVEITPHALLARGDRPVTSTLIRGLVATGEVAEAETLLGRPHRLRGVVARGRGVGASLGAPTANLVVDPAMAVPGDGVYAGVASVGGVRYAAAVTVGRPPSFPDADSLIEAHLLDFSGDLYDQPMTLEFHERLRGLEAFAELDDLRAAIAADIATVRRRQLV